MSRDQLVAAATYLRFAPVIHIVDLERATSTWNALLGINQRKDDFLEIGQLDDADATPSIEDQQRVWGLPAAKVGPSN